MKKFTLHIFSFILVVLLSILTIFHFANGKSDSFYLKVSSDKQKNLIVGTSKSAQGIQPAYLEKETDIKFYNYSFAISISPFGKTYLKSIKTKLDTSSKSNVFIVTVDSWSISSITKTPNDSLLFREKKYFLESVSEVNESPNYTYLWNHFEHQYYNILLPSTPATLHQDGWLEVKLSLGEKEIKNRRKHTMSEYKEKQKQYAFSDVRYEYLLKTIQYLKQYGKVYLVKLPIHNDLIEIEQELIPNFDSVINLAIKNSDGYYNMTKLTSNYTYTDGVHLTIESGREASITIGNWINSKRKSD